MIPAGRISGLFGGVGGVVLSLWDSFPSGGFDIEEPVFVDFDGHWVPLFFSEFRRRGVSGAVVFFDDITTFRRAAELVGREFFFRSSVVASSPDDFTGWQVRIGDLSGSVTAFFDSEVNPLFEVAIAGRTELIPAVPEFIVSLDSASKTIVLSLPEGLLGLNE